LIGLWSSAHLFGAPARALEHVGGFIKLLAVVLFQGTVWFVAAIGFDAGQPLLPDTNADVVMLLTVLVVGLLAASLVVALHYRRSFWKGMAITCLAGVFAARGTNILHRRAPMFTKTTCFCASGKDWSRHRCELQWSTQ
jgi:hypothetical protein